MLACRLAFALGLTQLADRMHLPRLQLVVGKSAKKVEAASDLRGHLDETPFLLRPPLPSRSAGSGDLEVGG